MVASEKERLKSELALLDKQLSHVIDGIAFSKTEKDREIAKHLRDDLEQKIRDLSERVKSL